MVWEGVSGMLDTLLAKSVKTVDVGLSTLTPALSLGGRGGRKDGFLGSSGGRHGQSGFVRATRCGLGFPERLD
jgi:hypothetical protein